MTANQAVRLDKTSKEGGMREWITLGEMQEILGIGSTKAYELAASGSIPGVIKIGRVIRVNKKELDGWLRDQAYHAAYK
jgi:excisionase family DNA binding protein